MHLPALPAALHHSAGNDAVQTMKEASVRVKRKARQGKSTPSGMIQQKLMANPSFPFAQADKRAGGGGGGGGRGGGGATYI